VTAEEQRILAGIYRLLKTIGEQVTMLGSVVSRAHGVQPFPAPRPTPIQPETPPMLHVRVPEQGELPLAGCVLAHKPRVWGNSVRWYEAAYKWTGGGPFGLADLFAARDELAEATKGKIGVATYQRVLSALVRAGAATRKGGVYTLRQPNDELREAVERVRNQKGGAK
jgi:hypothetical protein